MQTNINDAILICILLCTGGFKKVLLFGKGPNTSQRLAKIVSWKTDFFPKLNVSSNNFHSITQLQGFQFYSKTTAGNQNYPSRVNPLLDLLYNHSVSNSFQKPLLNVKITRVEHIHSWISYTTKGFPVLLRNHRWTPKLPM